jgi:hypothetical protein
MKTHTTRQTLAGPIPHANDTLSRCASAVLAIKRRQAIGEELDAQFDGGEFSRPAHARILQDELMRCVARFGFTPTGYDIAVGRRVCNRFAHFNELLID